MTVSKIDKKIVPHKGELIEIAHALRPIRSFADLGGCWGVNGGYSFHASKLIGPQLERGAIVDQHITALTSERAEKLPNIQLITGLLDSADSRKAVGSVDALIMFDILLHQVNPDWEEFILSWLPHANMLII